MPVIMTMMIITLVHGHPKVSHQEALTLEGRLGQISGSSFWQRAVSKSRRAALRRTRVLHRPRGSAESNYIYIYIYTYRERDIYTYIYVSLSLSLSIYIYICISYLSYGIPRRSRRASQLRRGRLSKVCVAETNKHR